jgi:thioredoxin-dependent peroxiredoxin
MSKKTKPVKKLVNKPVKKSSKKDSKPALKKASQTISKKTSPSLVGKSVPKLAVENSLGQSVSLKDFNGKTVVLYFYPKDDTPGCTLEGNEFSALVSKFESKNAVVLGISKDSVASHHKFICKHNYKVELLSDIEGKLCDFFGVFKEKNMYGKKYMGIERSTFIIDTNGKIIKEFRKVSAPGHAALMLSEI